MRRIQFLRAGDGGGQMRIYVGMMLLGEHTIRGANLRERAAAVKAERGVVIGFRALQVFSLLRNGVHVSFIDGWRFFAGGQQLRTLEQAAEIFFAGDGFRACLAGETGVGFVFHFQSFEANDADELSVFFPNLGLGEFHSGGNRKRKRIPHSVERCGMKLWKSLSLLFLSQERQ